MQQTCLYGNCPDVAGIQQAFDYAAANCAIYVSVFRFPAIILIAVSLTLFSRTGRHLACNDHHRNPELNDPDRASLLDRGTYRDLGACHNTRRARSFPNAGHLQDRYHRECLSNLSNAIGKLGGRHAEILFRLRVDLVDDRWARSVECFWPLPLWLDFMVVGNEIG